MYGETVIPALRETTSRRRPSHDGPGAAARSGGVAIPARRAGVIALVAIWELYKLLGPADGVVVGAVEGETGSGFILLPRTHDRVDAAHLGHGRAPLPGPRAAGRPRR